MFYLCYGIQYLHLHTFILVAFSMWDFKKIKLQYTIYIMSNYNYGITLLHI